MRECVSELARKHRVHELDIARPLVVNTAFESAYFVFHCSEHLIQALRESVASLIAQDNVFTDWPSFTRAKAEFRQSAQAGERPPCYAEVEGTASIPWQSFVDFYAAHPTIASLSHFGRSVPGIANEDSAAGVYKLLLEALAKLHRPVNAALAGGAAGAGSSIALSPRTRAAARGGGGDSDEAARGRSPPAPAAAVAGE